MFLSTAYNAHRLVEIQFYIATGHQICFIAEQYPNLQQSVRLLSF